MQTRDNTPVPKALDLTGSSTKQWPQSRPHCPRRVGFRLLGLLDTLTQGPGGEASVSGSAGEGSVPKVLETLR